MHYKKRHRNWNAIFQTQKKFCSKSYWIKKSSDSVANWPWVKQWFFSKQLVLHILITFTDSHQWNDPQSILNIDNAYITRYTSAAEMYDDIRLVCTVWIYCAMCIFLHGPTDFSRQGGQTTQLHCSVNSIGLESRSGSSSGCVCCHTTVFTDQLHHTSPTVCVDVLILRVVVVFVRLSQTHWLSRWRTGGRSATVRSATGLEWSTCVDQNCNVFALIPSATKDVSVSTVLLLTLDIPTLHCSVHNSWDFVKCPCNGFNC